MEIKDFYDPDHYLELYRKPFNLGKYTIATDGYVIIFLKIDEKYKEVKILENTEKMINEILNNIETLEFKSLPKFEIPEDIICPDCEGTKKSQIKVCEECNGIGSVDAETDYNTYYDLDCKSCSGEEKIINLDTDEECKRCEGKGKIEQENYNIEIYNTFVNFKHLKKIINIENIEVSTIKKNPILLFKNKTKDLKGAIIGVLI